MPDFRLGDYSFSRRQRRVTTAFSFLAMGVGLGALAALLVTPKSGKRLRRQMRRKYEDARDAMGDFADRASDFWERREEWAEAARRPMARRFGRG